MHTKISRSFFSVIVVLFLFSCKGEKVDEEIYIAEVGNEKLSQTELDNELGSNANISKYKEEYVRDWVETELLYQISHEDKLLDYHNFERVLKYSKKELAASIAIQSFLIQNPVEYSEKDIKNYYEKNKNDYSFSHNAYILNYTIFNDESKAINFRNSVINEGWQNSLSIFKNDSSLVNNWENKLFKLTEIQSPKITRVLQKLNKNEISLVIKTELNNFVVVQQIDEITKNSIPAYQYVKENVKASFLISKQKEQIRNYLDSLISNKNVKIY
jgi:hypothetical protein